MIRLKKQLVSLFTALLLSEISSLSAADTVSTFSVSGTVGSHVTVTVQGLDGTNTKSLYTDVTDQNFTDGYIIVTNGIQLRTVNSNKPVYLSIKNSGWTLPSTYDTTNGPKKADGSDSEFLIKIDTTTLSSTAGTIAVQGTYGTTYVAVTNTAGNILKLGQITSGGKKQGMKGGSVDINTKVLLNGVYDIPGTYKVNLELGITDQ